MILTQCERIEKTAMADPLMPTVADLGEGPGGPRGQKVYILVKIEAKIFFDP